MKSLIGRRPEVAKIKEALKKKRLLLGKVGAFKLFLQLSI